jgi:hypothetical protein
MQTIPAVRDTVKDALAVWFDDPANEHVCEGATACTG